MSKSSFWKIEYYSKQKDIEKQKTFFNDIMINLFILLLIKMKQNARREEKRRVEKRREEKLLPLSGEAPRNESLQYDNGLFEIKNESKLALILKEKTRMKYLNNKIDEYPIKKRKKKISSNKAIIKNDIIVIMIKGIMINIFCLIKSNIFDLSYIRNTSKITLKIKGTGNLYILSNHFENFNYLNEVFINGNRTETVANKYEFSKTDNDVELRFEDNITSCRNMFNGCSKIIEIDLSNFNTSKVISMFAMFYGCKSLTSLNLSNLDTSKAGTMGYMFQGCSSLNSLDLSSFETSNVFSMHGMFDGCSSLTTLNLSNFITSRVYFIEQMFQNCISLEYINLNNFVENSFSSGNNYDMFKNVPANIVICIDESRNQQKVLPQIKNISCYVIDCSNDWKSKQKSIINNTNECIESCNINSLNIFEYNGKCYDNCINGFLDDNNNNFNNYCKLCPNSISNSIKKCSKCTNNYYPKENDPLNIDVNLNCYKDLIGYYLDDNLYKQCYNTCKTCNTAGNNMTHNCIDCKDEFPKRINKNNNINCYIICENFYYFDDEDNYHCTINATCPYEYPKLIVERAECIKNDIKNIIKNVVSVGKNETVKMTKEEEMEYYENVIEIIEKGFTDNYDTTNMDKGEDEVIETEKMTITFTTPQNQKSNLNNNMSTIDLGDCEILLRNYYNISINETLYIKKIDIVQEGMKTQKVQYDVYCKLFGYNLIKLNLTACEKSKVSISIPIKVTEEQSTLQGTELQTFIDKLNSSSGYYNDICYTTTSEDGTDIPLNTRKIKYKDGNMIVCQEDCDFTKFDSQTFRAECSCKVKQTSSSIVDMNINKDKLFENFKDIKNFANFNFLVCHNKLFNKKGFIKNIGCYLISSIILVHILIIIFFRLKQFYLIKIKIKDITFGINEYQLIEEEKKIKKKKYKKRKKIKINKQLNNNINSDLNEMITTKKIKKKNVKKKEKK